MHHADDGEIAVTNALNEDTSVHWHRLLVPAELDGGPHQLKADEYVTSRAAHSSTSCDAFLSSPFSWANRDRCVRDWPATAPGGQGGERCALPRNTALTICLSCFRSASFEDELVVGRPAGDDDHDAGTGWQYDLGGYRMRRRAFP